MGAKTCITFIMLWTMIQAAAYLTISLMAILAHACELEVNGDRLLHFIYTIYFRHNDCGPTNWNLLLDTTEILPITPSMPDLTHTIIRTNIIAIVYFITSCIWFLSSFLLLVTTCCNCCGKFVYKFTLWIWIITTFLIIMVDAAASGIFTWDLLESLDMNTFLLHFEITVPPEIGVLNIPNYILVIPSTILLAISTRGIIFWIFNIVFIFIGYNFAKRIIRTEYNNKFEQIQRPNFGNDQTNQNIPMDYNSRTVNQNIDTSYINQPESYPSLPRAAITHFNGSNPNYIEQTNPQTNQMPLPIIHSSYYEYNEPIRSTSPSTTRIQHTNNYPAHERRYFEPLKNDTSSSNNNNNQSPSRQQKSIVDQPPDYYQHASSTKQLPPPPNPKPIRNSSTYATATTAAAAAPGRNFIPNINQMDQRNSNIPPPEELRSQLPWSYFQNRNDVSGPKKQFNQFNETDELPPVPVPDYTLHFPRKERGFSNSTDEGGKYNFK